MSFRGKVWLTIAVLVVAFWAGVAALVVLP